MDMPFGKYKGDDLEDIPNSYLQWLSDQGIEEGILKDEIEDELLDREVHGIIIKD